MMNCYSSRSLENQALVKIASILWNNHAVVSLTEFNFQTSTCVEKLKEWQPIENKIIGKVSTLILPEILKRNLVCLIRPVGLQIFKWKEYQQKISNNNFCFKTSVSKLCWSSRGLIDYGKTAQNLIQDKNLEAAIRFKVACSYSFEKEINLIWDNELSAAVKKKLSLKKILFTPNLVQLWTAILTNAFHAIPNHRNYGSIWSYAFTVALKYEAKTAVEFFWLKLTSEEKIKYWPVSFFKIPFYAPSNTCNFFPKSYYGDIVCFLLSNVSEDMKSQLSIENCKFQLEYFLEWPHQNCFLEVAKQTLETLTDFDCDYIFLKLIHKIAEGCIDFDYQNLIREFWKLCPEAYRSYSANIVTLPRLLPHLFHIKNKENISFLLRDVTPKQKEQLAFRHWGKDICLTLAENNEWYLVDFFISEFLPTESKIIRFRDKYFHETPSMKKSARLDTDIEIDSKMYSYLNSLLPNYSKKRKGKLASEVCDKKLCNRYPLRNLKK